MNIFLAQQNYHIGNFVYNTNKIIHAIREAKHQGGDLIIFPELAICGYPPADFLEFDGFIERTQSAIDMIRKETADIGVLIGAPARNPVPEGKDLFNSAYLLHEEKITGVVHKTLLPTYDIFDEYRYFEPASSWQVLTFKGRKLAVTICEDIWHTGENPLYRSAPLDQLMAQQPELIINISASPFDYLQSAKRLDTIRETVSRYSLPLVYCNTTGAQTALIFDGGSMAMNRNQEIVLQLPHFCESLQCITLIDADFTPTDIRPTPVESVAIPAVFQPERYMDSIYEALLLGIRDYFGKMGFQKAIVASSGGIDSAVVLALACEALGAGNVQALLMPSTFSSAHSVEDARLLSDNMGNPYVALPINRIFDAFTGTLRPLFDGLPTDVTEENIQSRIRGALVMAVSNKFGSILLNTSNKSELATGYGTLYGDMAGGLSVLGDLYKTQVYALARYINREQMIIPERILTKPPSAELRPDQKDSDTLPEYPLLDAVLYQYIECRRSPEEIIAAGYDQVLVRRIAALVNNSEYKRYQFCPVLRVSPKSFGSGRRMPVVGKYL